MSSYLEPSFLLELGAYAVAAAGIRIFKSKYWRNGVLPSANGTPHVEQPVATVQAAPPVVLGLGQASPLKAPASPRRSPSSTLQVEPQLATPVAPPPFHEEDLAAIPFPARCGPLPAEAAVPGLATDTEMAETSADDVEEAPVDSATNEEHAAEEVFPEGLAVDATAAQPPAPATATASDADEIRPDASRLDLKAHATITDMLPQPADEPSVPCSCVNFDTMKDDLLGANSTDDREICDNADIEAPSHTTPGMEAPSLTAKQHNEMLGHLVLQPELLTETEERDGDQAARDMADRHGRANARGRSLPATGASQAAEINVAAAAARDAPEATDRASEVTEQRKAALAADAERQRQRRASTTAAQRMQAVAAHAARQRARRAQPSQTFGQRAAALAADAARQRARRGQQCSDLVSEPPSAPDAAADIREMWCEPHTAATSGHDAQAASEILATLFGGEPSFSKVACVGKVTKVCGGDLIVMSPSSAAGSSDLNGSAEPAEHAELAEPVEVSSHNRPEATGQEHEEAAEEGVSVMCESSDEEEGIATVSKSITQHDSPPCFDLDVPRDTILSSRASAQQGSSALGLVMDGSGGDEELQPAEEAVLTHRDILLRAAQRHNTDKDHQLPRDSGLSFISNCFKQPYGNGSAGHTAAEVTEAKLPCSVLTGSFPGSNDGSHQLQAELPVASASPKVGQSTPSGGGMTPSGVGQNPPSMGPDPTPASSDCQPQEEGEDQIAPGSSRATAVLSDSFLPIAGSVFDDAPGPESAADFDDAPMPVDAVMFDGGQMMSVQEEEETSPERSVEAMETGLVSEEEEGGQSQLQQPDQATADVISHPTDAVSGAGDEEEGAGVRMSLRDSPAKEEDYGQVPCEQFDQATEPESAVGTAYRRIRRYWHLRANVEHSHESNCLPNGDKHSPNADPSCLDDPGVDDPADPGESGHVSGMLTKDQCTWVATEFQHDSSEHLAQAEEEDWACVLPQVDSAPPVTPDSPDHSSAPPNSPSWGGSGGEWESAPRAAPDSCPQSSWDSPPRTAPNSPAFACSPAPNCPSQQRTPPRAMSSSPPSRAVSSSPAPMAISPDDSAWPSGTQAATPTTHESTPPSEKYSRGGDVVGDLDGGYACGSYAYPPPPATPISPSPPPSSPPHQSDTLSWRCGHFRTRFPMLDSPKSSSPRQSDTQPWKRRQLRTRKHSLGLLGAFPTSPESPIHHESPALVAPDDAQLHAEPQCGQEAVPATPLPYSCMATWHESAADKPQQWDSPPPADDEDGAASGIKQAKAIFGKHIPRTYGHQVHWSKSFELNEEAQHGEPDSSGLGAEEGQGEREECPHEEGMEGAAAASSPEPVPDLPQAGEQEELTEESADERQGFGQGRAVSLSPQPSPEHSGQSSPRASSESASVGPPRYPHSKIPEANGHCFDEETVEVGLLEEEDGAEGPSGASSPQPEQPEMMLEDNEGEECFEDDEVQFVSETGADPSRSAFSAAVRRLEEDDSEIELYPGMQDLISGALQSRLAKHSRQSVVDDEVDVGTDRSRGRGPLRHKRGCPTSPEARGRRPSQVDRQSLHSRHGRHSHSPNHQQLFCEEDEDVSPGRAVSLAGAVSAAAGSHEARAGAGAGAGAGSGARAAAAAGPSGRHARRLRDMLSVAEEDIEVDDMDADMTRWRKLLKKPRR